MVVVITRVYQTNFFWKGKCSKVEAFPPAPNIFPKVGQRSFAWHTKELIIQLNQTKLKIEQSKKHTHTKQKEEVNR